MFLVRYYVLPSTTTGLIKICRGGHSLVSCTVQLTAHSCLIPLTRVPGYQAGALLLVSDPDITEDLIVFLSQRGVPYCRLKLLMCALGCIN